MNTTGTPPLQAAYRVVLGVASGFSLGWFTWVVVSRQLTDPPFWPFAATGAVAGVLMVRLAAASPRGRAWMHVLWVPVAAFVLLMAAIVLALRSWGG